MSEPGDRFGKRSRNARGGCGAKGRTVVLIPASTRGASTAGGRLEASSLLRSCVSEPQHLCFWHPGLCRALPLCRALQHLPGVPRGPASRPDCSPACPSECVCRCWPARAAGAPQKANALCSSVGIVSGSCVRMHCAAGIVSSGLAWFGPIPFSKTFPAAVIRAHVQTSRAPQASAVWQPEARSPICPLLHRCTPLRLCMHAQCSQDPKQHHACIGSGGPILAAVPSVPCSRCQRLRVLGPPSQSCSQAAPSRISGLRDVSGARESERLGQCCHCASTASTAPPILAETNNLGGPRHPSTIRPRPLADGHQHRAAELSGRMRSAHSLASQPSTSSCAPAQSPALRRAHRFAPQCLAPRVPHRVGRVVAQVSVAAPPHLASKAYQHAITRPAFTINKPRLLYCGPLCASG